MKKKLLFGITGLTLGGAERVLVDLANTLCDTYDITIFTIYAKGELEKQISKKIKLKSLYSNSYCELSKLKKYIIMPLRILLFKNRIYNNNIKDNYDVEIAFLEGPITRLFSVKNNNTKKVAWIHNDISVVFGKGIKAKVKKRLDQKTYLKYDNLIFVSNENLEKFKETYPKIDVNKRVIYNYIERKNILQKAKEEQKDKFKPDEINFVTVARLVPQKGIDRLIKVHTKLIKEGLKNHIYIIGEGEERKKLEQMIKENKINETFTLLGKKENPYPYIKNADYFCLFSRFEGYGMVLEEAKILNKPILITNTAAREAVEGYSRATIVNNEEKDIYKVMKQKIKEQKPEEQIKENQTEENNIIFDIIKMIEEK